MNRLCKDCKWCVNPGQFAECHAPQNFRADATGFNKKPKYIFCTAQRLQVSSRWFQLVLEFIAPTDCGLAGRWWEPKP